MEVTIRETVNVTYDVPFQFPVYRLHQVGEDVSIYYKFETPSQVTRITETLSETKILAYNEKGADFLHEFMNKDMLEGNYAYSIIPESMYKAAETRLINLVANS